MKLSFENIHRKIENEQQILETCVAEASETQIMLEVQKVNRNVNGHKSFVSNQSAKIKEYNISLKKTDFSRSLETAFVVIFELSKSKIVESCYTSILAVNRFGMISGLNICWSSKGVGAICFWVSTDIKLHGFLSYGCKDGRSNCKVIATLKDDTKEINVT